MLQGGTMSLPLQEDYQGEGELSETRAWGAWQTSGEANGELWDSLVCVEVKVSTAISQSTMVARLLPLPGAAWA